MLNIFSQNTRPCTTCGKRFRHGCLPGSPMMCPACEAGYVTLREQGVRITPALGGGWEFRGTVYARFAEAATALANAVAERR